MTTHTIGKVLEALTDEFDDITISKIRYLEAEGLIHPDRSDSGYRKFDDADVERLRYVLRSQRDRYLPLKVIRDELDRIDAGLPVEADAPALEALDEPSRDAARGDEPKAGSQAVPKAIAPPAASLLDEPATDVSLTLAELAEASGLETSVLVSLRDHGLLVGDNRFDGDDLQAARAAAALLELGLEPRHVRMYRQFVNRELALHEQLVSALLRQRNPDSRRTARTQVERLVSAGEQLHRVLLGRELRKLLRS